MESFYALFISLEKKYVGERQYFYEDGKFIRVFVRPENVSAEEAGEGISDYIRMFDSCLKTYFSNTEQIQKFCVSLGSAVPKPL